MQRFYLWQSTLGWGRQEALRSQGCCGLPMPLPISFPSFFFSSSPYIPSPSLPPFFPPSLFSFLLSVLPWLSWKSLCRSGWPWTQRCPVSRELGLKACATMVGAATCFWSSPICLSTSRLGSLQQGRHFKLIFWRTAEHPLAEVLWRHRLHSESAGGGAGMASTLNIFGRPCLGSVCNSISHGEMDTHCP